MVDGPLVIVSADCHVGPRLVEDLRGYCPTSLLGAFDQYVADDARSQGRYVPQPQDDGVRASKWRNRATDGHHDPVARRRDLDFEGIAAEVIFHGSQNDQPIPFQTSMLGPPADPGLATVGMQIYNRWLAEFCAQAPHRHAGLVHLPLWDLDASIAELEWAAGAGLRGVNFPAPRPWLRPYNHPTWEPFWAAAEQLHLPLTTHAGAGEPSLYTGHELTALMSIESGGWLSRRAAHILVFAGVFERHPGLQLVLTEQPGEWWPYMCQELDSVHLANAEDAALICQVPSRPSDYLQRNVYIGASFVSRAEALGAVVGGYADRMMWGADYPHMEGTFQYPGTDDFAGHPSYTRLSLRFALAGMDEDDVRAVVGGTAMSVYGLDGVALSEVAVAIGAPTFGEISVPLDTIPAGASPFAFRTFGPWS
jgi:predicted TIM-barrel fold metal-dependent hydrolase